MNTQTTVEHLRIGDIVFDGLLNVLRIVDIQLTDRAWVDGSKPDAERIVSFTMASSDGNPVVCHWTPKDIVQVTDGTAREIAKRNAHYANMEIAADEHAADMLAMEAADKVAGQKAFDRGEWIQLFTMR